MTFSLSPGDINDIVEIASIVGTIVSLAIFALVVWFLVRPKRRRDVVERQEADPVRIEEMLVLMDRMERRLATLERAIGEDRAVCIAPPDEDNRILEAAEGRETGRTK